MLRIEVNEVFAGYAGNEILHGVHLTLAAGEAVTIIGPNGAGKSTLLKVIMGYVLPRAGTVRLDGRPITHLRTDQRVREGIAYVPQLDNVFPSLTVAENLAMGGHLLPRRQLHERVESIYAEFPLLQSRARQRVGTLSGGQRQLLAMARALMTEPTVLLLDEPSAALSPQMADTVFEQIGKINAGGRAILIVEQEARRALEISQRGYVLVDGKNAYESTARTMLDDEKVRAAFLGAATAPKAQSI